MLQKVHDHLKGWVVALLIGVLAVSFVIWGIQYYWQSAHNQDAVAVVDGQKITANVFDTAFRGMQRAALAQGIRVNAEMSAELRHLTLNQMIQNILLQQGALKAGFVVTEAQAVQWLGAFPALQESGHFSQKRLNTLLQAQGVSLNQLVEQVRDSMLIHQVEWTFLGSAFVLPNEWQAEYRRLYETRDVRYVVIPSARFQGKQAVPLATQKAYYAAHLDDFRLPLRVQVEYVTLSPQHKSATMFTQQVERLGELAYTESGSLAHVAQQLQVPVQTSGWVNKGATNLPVADAWLAATSIQSLLWSHDLLEEGLNAEPQTLSDGRVVVFRVVAHAGGDVQPFDKVRSQVMLRVGHEWALAQSALVAHQVAKVLRAGHAPTPMDWSPASPDWVSVQNMQRVPQSSANTLSDALRLIAFSLQKKSTSVGVAVLPNGDSAVVELMSVHVPLPTKISAKEQSQFEQFLVKRNGDLAYQLYTTALRNAAHIEEYQ